MKKRIFFFLLPTLILNHLLWAQDPLKVNPEQHRLLLENETVRVYETRLAPGEKTGMHYHPQNFVYSLNDARLKIALDDGAAQEVSIPSGAAAWSDPVHHVTENIGDKEAVLLHVEFKPKKVCSEPVRHMRQPYLNADQIKWTDAPPTLPKGCQIAVLEGDPSKPGPFTARFRIPAGTRLAPHFHPSQERATVLSGLLKIGIGAQFDESKMVEIGPGGFLLMPAGERHYAHFEQDSELQLTGTGPWELVYVNRDEDPQKQKNQE